VCGGFAANYRFYGVRALAILGVRAAALDILVSAVNKKAFRLFGWISDLAFWPN
jgi:hypothetical protein